MPFSTVCFGCLFSVRIVFLRETKVCSFAGQPNKSNRRFARPNFTAIYWKLLRVHSPKGHIFLYFREIIFVLWWLFLLFFAGPPLRLGRVFDVNIQAFIVGILRMVLVKVSKCNSFQWTFFMLKLGIDFVYSIEIFSCNLIIEFYLFRNLCDLSFVEKFWEEIIII